MITCIHAASTDREPYCSKFGCACSDQKEDVCKEYSRFSINENSIQDVNNSDEN